MVASRSCPSCQWNYLTMRASDGTLLWPGEAMACARCGQIIVAAPSDPIWDLTREARKVQVTALGEALRQAGGDDMVTALAGALGGRATGKLIENLQERANEEKIEGKIQELFWVETVPGEMWYNHVSGRRIVKRAKDGYNLSETEVEFGPNGANFRFGPIGKTKTLSEAKRVHWKRHVTFVRSLVV